MNKFSFLLLTLFTIGCVFVSCSDENEQIEDVQRINEFKQKCQELADQYGLMIMFSNEYIAERINWSYGQLEQEMKEISKSFLEIDSLGTNSDKRSMRPRMIGSYEFSGQTVYDINAPADMDFVVGQYAISFTTGIKWNSFGNLRGTFDSEKVNGQMSHHCIPNCPHQNESNHGFNNLPCDITITPRSNIDVYGYPSYNNMADVQFKIHLSVTGDTTFTSEQTFILKMPYTVFQTGPTN